MFIGDFYLACCVAWSMPEWIVKFPDYFGQIFIECGYINGHMYTHIKRVFIIT